MSINSVKKLLKIRTKKEIKGVQDMTKKSRDAYDEEQRPSKKSSSSKGKKK